MRCCVSSHALISLALEESEIKQHWLHSTEPDAALALSQDSILDSLVQPHDIAADASR
jgi:hypothetical protein